MRPRGLGPRLPEPRAHPVDEAARKEHLDLPARDVVARLERAPARDVLDADGVALAHLAAEVPKAEHVALSDPVDLGRVVEPEREDAEVDEVLPVDSRESRSDDEPQAEEA